jgi:peptidoglycan/xylan/chitin deacetylase (PgdA/CDA1 family)
VRGTLGAATQAVGRRVAQVPRLAAQPALRRRCARAGALVLTYDDGPGRRLTPQLLDLLAAHDAHATFYVLGRQVREAPDVVDRIVAEGHELASHGYAHVNAGEADRRACLEDIRRGYEALAGWDRRPAAYRPPYGRLRPHMWRHLRSRGVRLGWWTIDSRDSLLAEPDLGLVVDRVDRAGGGIVLLHDFDRADADRDRERFTLEATAALLELARRRGWSATTQSKLR